MTPEMTEKVPVHLELITGLLNHLLKSGIPKENVDKLNEALSWNCRILRDEEIPYEPVDENLKRKVERLEREVEETKAKVEDARASWPDLQRRCLNAVTVQIPEENECTEEDGPPSDAEIPPSQIQDLRKWSKGALSKRAELNLEAMTSIEEKTDQVQTAITSYASAVSSDGKGSGTPERTIEIADTPPSTPLSAARAAREAFAKRGLSLPAFSPNVTPRSRRVRRTLSASRRISSLR